MKDKIVYLLVFTILFIAVSAGLVYFTSIYNNIFWFDFSPPKSQVNLKDKKANQNTAQKDSLAVKENQPVAQDSTKITATETDSLKTNETPKEAKKETAKETPKKNNEVKNVNATVKNNNSAAPITTPPVQIPAQASSVSNLSKIKKDSVYNSWIKETVQLYESMDSRKAAKVIQGYSDNIARDIILKMKKKKAAEILAEIKPEVVTRIISVTP